MAATQFSESASAHGAAANCLRACATFAIGEADRFEVDECLYFGVHHLPPEEALASSGLLLRSAAAAGRLVVVRLCGSSRSGTHAAGDSSGLPPWLAHQGAQRQKCNSNKNAAAD